MGKKYKSYTPAKDGSLAFTEIENQIWNRLFDQQIEVIKDRACDEFTLGLNKLNLPIKRVPFPIEVSRTLTEHTGWIAEPVPAVIGAKDFFTLLANRKFPAACFIRNEDDFHYIQEPDIFHEIFGHCPLLTNQHYANFIEKYGKFALTCKKEERKYLFRLFWFTIEFGLIKTENGDRIYGGGILSSIEETQSALNNSKVQYEDFDLLKIFRTPFRIDIPQTLYFRIDSLKQLFESLDQDLNAVISEAARLGDIKPMFNPVDGQGDQLEYTN